MPAAWQDQESDLGLCLGCSAVVNVAIATTCLLSIQDAQHAYGSALSCITIDHDMLEPSHLGVVLHENSCTGYTDVSCVNMPAPRLLAKQLLCPDLGEKCMA